MRRLRALGLLLLAQTVTASEPPLRFEQISVAEGLAQSSVYCMLQDRLGFLWVGGEFGLNRYDGYRLEHFIHDPDDPGSLPSNQIRALLEDRDGTIWIGTVDAGLARYDYRVDAFETRRHRAADVTSLSSDDVRALAATPDGNLWVGTAAGVDCRRAGGDGFRRYTLDPLPGRARADTGVTAFAVGPVGRLWAGSEGGLYRYEPIGDRFTPYVDASGPFAISVSSLECGSEDVLWAGTAAEGLALLDVRGGGRRWWRRGASPSAALSGDSVTAVRVDHRGRVWVGTFDGGLALVDPRSGGVRHIPLRQDDEAAPPARGIRSLLEDRSRLLWIGTSFDGLHKTDLKASGFHPVAARGADGKALADRVVFAVAESADGALWIGGSDGVYRVDRRTGLYRAYRPDPVAPDRPVYAVLPEADGSLWIGTWGGGLIRMDPLTGVRTVYRHDPEDGASLSDDRPLVLLPDDRGRLWVGTWGGGLDLLDRATGRFVHHRVADGTGLASDRIRALCEGENGRLWVGTTGGGLSLLDPATGRFETSLASATDPRGLSSNDIAYIHRSRDGSVWVATAMGLNRLDPATGRFVSWRAKHGLPSDALTAVLEDAAGTIWVAHFAGISRFDPATSSFTSFVLSDGLASTEFNAGAAFAAASGELFFGGVGGLTAVKPAEVTRNPHPPRAVLTGCSVYGRELRLPGSISVTSEIRLSHEQDFLGFEFTGLEFTAPARNAFAHRLVGYHSDWVACGARRYASYTNLPPGRYAFEVKSANGHGVWGEPARLRIVIAPPFWRTWWFRAASLATLALMLLGAFGWRTRALHARLGEQERLVAERTSQLTAANAELQALATHDELTSVANRRLFNEFLEAEWRRAARFRRQISIALIDIDDFKRYNDAFGHPAGDACLAGVAAAIGALAKRPGDLLARFGGEEFVVVFSETGPAEATALAERLREAVEALALPHAPSAAARTVTISVGVATVTASAGTSSSRLVASADAALYAAKAAGKNRVVLAGP